VQLRRQTADKIMSKSNKLNRSMKASFFMHSSTTGMSNVLKILKKKLVFYLFQINMFLVFLNYFNTLISKIILKK